MCSRICSVSSRTIPSGNRPSSLMARRLRQLERHAPEAWVVPHVKAGEAVRLHRRMEGLGKVQKHTEATAARAEVEVDGPQDRADPPGLPRIAERERVPGERGGDPGQLDP